MGKLVVTEFVTLDGVFEDPGGSEGKDFGGWQRPLMGDDEGQFKFAELKNADAILLGRVTYEGFAAVWPGLEKETGEFGQLMNSLPKYVASLTISEFTWNNSHGLGADIFTEVTKLKQQYQGDILVYGSGQLVKSLLENNLVDELHLLVYPLVLGQGRRLFDGALERTLKLIETKMFTNGTVLLNYSQAAKEIA